MLEVKRAMKEKNINNARIERRHAEEREEICMLHTLIDYLPFLYTPPLCEVGTQVDRFRVPDTRFAGISSSKILIGQCTQLFMHLFIWPHRAAKLSKD